jgi:uncharacterized protein (TIGR02596 family)
MKTRPPHRKTAAFSLVELLVVMAIVSGLAVIGGMVTAGMIKGNQLSQGGLLVGTHLSLARQEAVSRNKDVQVIFLDTLPDVPGWEALQVRCIDVLVSGTREIPIGKVTPLPTSVTITSDAGYTKILSNTSSVQGTYSGGAYDGIKYTGFVFRSNGSLESRIVPGQNYLTLIPRNLPANFTNYYTLQINPVTGAVQVYRP